MANEDKGKVIAKIVKLFLEFLIAAVVAWFGASCVRSSKRLPKCPDTLKTEISNVVHLRVNSPICLRNF